MWAVLFVGCLLSQALAKVSQGTLVKDNVQWVLIDSFCFDSRGGVFTIDWVTYDKRFPNQEIVMYHDIQGPGGFPKFYQSKNSCKKKTAGVAPNARIRADDIRLVPGGTGITRNIVSMVPRWWYIVLANCEPGGGLPEGVGLLDYHFTFTNSNNGTFVSQFGKDQQGVYETSIVVLILLLIFLGVNALIIWRRRREAGDLSHKVLGCLFFIAIIHFLEIVCQLAHRDAFADDGIGHPLLEKVAIALDTIVQLCLVALFVVVAKGLYISSTEVRGLRSVVQIMVLYLAASMALLYWAYTSFNPGLTFTIYQSPAGVILVALRLATLCWLVTSIQTSWKREHLSNKRAFYVWFGLFAIVWFLSFPVVVLLAELMNSWNRRRTVWIVQQMILLFTYIGWWLFFGRNAMYLKKDTESGHGEIAQDDHEDLPTAATV